MLALFGERYSCKLLLCIDPVTDLSSKILAVGAEPYVPNPTAGVLQTLLKRRSSYVA